jgi:glycosyltransferase involved in cell wall biosynthesis
VEAIARAAGGESVAEPARILLVCSPARGGMASHVIALLKGLQADGYQVGVACEPEGVIAEVARELEVPAYAVKLRGSGVSSARRPAPRAPEAPASPLRSALAAPSAALRAGLHVRQASAAMRAQIIHTHSFRAGMLGAAILAMPLTGGVRLVATIHSYPPGAHTMRGRHARHPWAIRLVVRRASRLITVSEALRRELVEAWPDAEAKSICIPNGVDTRAETVKPAAARAALGLAVRGPVIGMMARLAPQKGIADFLHAARIVASGYAEASFVLAGDGPLRGQAEALRGELSMEDRLHLLGHISSPREFMAALDVLVVASTSEGSSVAAMEAMAAGRPVVATAVGGVPEVVTEGETGLLVKPSDPEALAAAVAQLLADPARAREMGERGRQQAAQRFDVRQMIARTEEVYADVIREELERRELGR